MPQYNIPSAGALCTRWADTTLFQLVVEVVEHLPVGDVHTHMIRTQRVPFIQSRAAWPVLLTTGGIMIIGTAIPFTRFGMHIGLQPLPGTYFTWLAGTLIAYCALTQMIKRWYIRRFSMWL
jgi:P-type Mg2+ transporter